MGVIHWDEVLGEVQQAQLVAEITKDWFDAPADAEARLDSAFERLREIMYPFPAVKSERYEGTREQRRQLRNLNSFLIGRYVRALALNPDDSGSSVISGEENNDEVRVLKRIARTYVIGLPALHAQQFGQKRIVRELFEIFAHETNSGKAKFIPKRLRHIWEVEGSCIPRAAADCIASLTENEAYQLHRRLTGMETGSILDPLVR